MAMNSWYPSRRDFLKQASVFALTSGVVLRQAVAQTAADNNSSRRKPRSDEFAALTRTE